VTDDLDRQVGQAPRRQKKISCSRRHIRRFVSAIAAAGGFLWFDYGDLIRSASFAGQRR
jgi:hypothetical protein